MTTNPDLHRLADLLGVTLRNHNGGPKGWWHAPTRTISTRRGLPIAQYKSTLAHELGHAYFGDENVRDPVRRSRQERRADKWAASLLLDGEDVGEALIFRSGHLASAAYDLEVTSHLLTVYLDHSFRPTSQNL